ncbi:MAG: 16S rRNA (adenine(1518)-N(6)/adenine(1519)-N(6))-dimethyltransferase RsmA [Crocinitomicaceae bacterium]
MRVKAKKHLGQHFLKDASICQRIVGSIGFEGSSNVLEVGPGTGALTKWLLESDKIKELYLMEVDQESVEYLNITFPILKENLLFDDFLRYDLDSFLAEESFNVIGNFPYNISSQILFRCLDFKDRIPEIVGMFQKEVAERIAEGPGKKKYGILSVFMQAYYDVEYLFTVDEDVFDPPPKVKSGVLRCVRNERKSLPCNEKLFKVVVKTAFNQRRKTLRNSLKSLLNGLELPENYSGERPEQCSVEDFITLTNLIETNKS